MSRRLPGPNIPRPTVVTRIRQAEEADGVRMRLSGAGIIVRIADNSDGRRQLTRWADAHGVNLVRLTPEPGVHHSRSSQTRRGGIGRNDVTTARADYQALGAGLTLRALAAQPFVVGAEDIVSIRIPLAGQGSGPEKVRPSMGSAFGRPEQVKATGAALAHDRSQNAIRARRTGEL